jgi:LCP family protein required for cell wall assembly
LRFLVGGVLIVLLSAGTTLTFTLETVSKVAHDLTLGGQQIKSPALTADQAGAAQTILVIGSDRRAQSRDVFDRSDPPHTDTILLVRMDPGQGQTSVLSVPRDLLVSFNGPKGYYPDQKINAAYTYGGAPLTLKVLEQTLPGLKINHVIDLNFASFRQVVDAIGCVYVDVDRRYYNLNVGTPETDYANINVQPGYQKLCGQTALDYVPAGLHQAGQGAGRRDGPVEQLRADHLGLRARGADRHPRYHRRAASAQARGLLAGTPAASGQVPGGLGELHARQGELRAVHADADRGDARGLPARR